VLFTTATEIVNALAASQASGGFKREMNKYLKPSVLAIDLC
jgi:DNA replication protein DnaC